jgi:hypothetical protein
MSYSFVEQIRPSIGGLLASCYTKCCLVFHLFTMVRDLVDCVIKFLIPLFSEVTDKMYEKILQDPLLFGPEIGSQARSILTGLLTRDPVHRLGANGAEEIKRHPFFAEHIDFKKLSEKKIQPPFKPSVASPVVCCRFSNNGLYSSLEGIHRMFRTSTLCLPTRNLLTALLTVLTCHRLFKINLQVRVIVNFYWKRI